MTAEEAVAQAEAEGLTLVRPEPGRSGTPSSTGYKGVSFQYDQFHARVWRDGKLVKLGSYATAEEAALQYSRHVGREAAAAEAAAAERTDETTGIRVISVLSVPLHRQDNAHTPYAGRTLGTS